MTGLAMSDQKSVLSEAEAAQVEADFRAELEAEHINRSEAQVRREERSKDKLRARERERQVLAEEELKEKLRADFHREKGYKLYTDSAGREHWLTPEEYDWRMRIRARHDKNRRRFEGSHTAKRRMMLMYGAAAVLAIIIGLVLVK
jgi:hypothetical protein